MTCTVVQAPSATAAAGAVLGDQRAGREGGGRQPPTRDLQIRAQRPGHQDPPSTEDLRLGFLVTKTSFFRGFSTGLPHS
jgi:hypothetical protein